MNIFRYFQKKEINTLDPSFYRKIDEWKSWYDGNVKRFSRYREYTGRGTYNIKYRKSLGMAKKLSEDIADLLLNERVQLTVDDEVTGSYVKDVLDRNNFLVLGNDYQERKAFTGTVAYIPYIKNGVTDGQGRIRTGEIAIDYVSAENIFPVSWENGKITECVFLFPKTYNRKKYIHLQLHHIVNGLYEIENSVIEVQQGNYDGRELTEQEWKQIAVFENLTRRNETFSEKPQFVIDRLNIVNNADNDQSNPMGVAIFANAIDSLKSVDIKYDSYSNEFETGRKRIFVSPEMMKNVDGTLAFDPNDSVFYLLPDNYSDGVNGTKMLQEINTDLRVEQHSKAINDELNYLSLKCGFGTERYKFESGNVKTATEVISENSDMYRMIKKHEIILESALKELIKIIIRLGMVLNNPLNPDVEIKIDFDDSIIEDKQAERTSDRQDVSMGVMSLAEYRAKWYGETEEEALKKVQEPTGVIE